MLRKSEREMQHIRGNDIAMVFQDPMASLNPVFPVGDQIAPKTGWLGSLIDCTGLRSPLRYAWYARTMMVAYRESYPDE